MSSQESEAGVPVSPGSPRVRCTVVRVDRPTSGMQVGDWFEVHGSQLVIPKGTTVSIGALSAVAPVVVLRQMDLPADNWFVRKPFICGPDAQENLIMRVEALPVTGADA